LIEHRLIAIFAMTTLLALTMGAGQRTDSNLLLATAQHSPVEYTTSVRAGRPTPAFV
jgi:divalent metal cation (Fe/Co/Zn/Cd) transporter